jgi:carbon-monoxide dehydrogenase large subunit
MNQFGMAQSVRRMEDLRLLTGNGRYTDDINPAGTVHGVVLRSPHAAAKLGAIDTSAVCAMPGVLGIFTGADLKADNIGGVPCLVELENRDGTKQAMPPHPLLAQERVRHVGDPVAFVVAETAQQARDAAEAVVVNYDFAPSITDLAKATEPGLRWCGTMSPATLCSTGRPGKRKKRRS